MARETERHGLIAQDLLATASGMLVGFVLGLVGGGGSVLAVPMSFGAVSPDRTRTHSGEIRNHNRSIATVSSVIATTCCGHLCQRQGTSNRNNEP